MYQIIAQHQATARRLTAALTQEPLVIGAAASAAMQLDGAGVEPDHCHITLRADGTVKLVDQHTAAGTSVNGGLVAQKLLEIGDRIEIGGWVLGLVSQSETGMATEGLAGAPASQARAGQSVPGQSQVGAPASRPPAPPSMPAPRSKATTAGFPSGEEFGDPVLTPAETPRRTYRKGGSGALRGVLIAAVSVVAVGVVLEIAGPFGNREALGGTTYVEDRIELARVLRDGGRLSEAMQTLVALREEKGAVAGLDRAVRQVAQAEDREKNARDQLGAILTDARATDPQRVERLVNLLGEYHDVAAVRLEMERAIADLRMSTRLTRHGDTMFGDELQDLSDAYLRTRNYASARGVWSKLSDSPLAVDQARMDAGVMAVDAAASVAAGKMIADIDQMLARNDVLAALIVMDAAEVQRFQGTPAFAELAARGEQLDAMVAVKGGGPLVVGPHAARAPRDHSADAVDTDADDELDAPTVVPVPTPGPTQPKAPTPARPAVAERAPDSDTNPAFVDGDRLFHAGDFTGSVTAYQEALAASGTTSGVRTQLTRRLERSNRAQWFLDALRNRIEADVSRVAALKIQDRAGVELGSVVGATESGLRVMPADGSSFLGGDEVAMAEIASDSIHRLARKYTFTPEDHLNRACFLLQGVTSADADRSAVEAALLVAQEDPALKQPLDSVVAFARGMQEIPEWGFFHYDGTWMTFREREETENRIAVGVTVKKLDRAEKDEEKYAAALEELKTLIPVAREEVVKVLRKRRAEMVAELTTSPELPAIERVFATRRDLEAKRETALELIFDEVKYFYPYSDQEVPQEKASLYPKVQQEVDDLVEEVRKVWGGEFDEFAGGVSTSSRFRSLMKRLETEGAILRVADPDGFVVEPELAVFGLLPLDAPRIHVRNIALTLEERAVLDRNLKVLAYNSTAKTSARSHEVDQIRITNDYRMMMGRSALAIHDLLCKSAWGHADWMSRGGPFGHFNTDDPALRTPGDRIKAQGYVGSGSGENCARTGSAMDAHLGWFGSSGHHRNILYESHTELGVGGVGPFWVQNFAGGRAYRGNLGDLDDR